MEAQAKTFPRAPTRAIERCGAHYALLAFGWLNVALGAIGVVVPGLPTTVFLLMALWAFSKSSARFHGWLYNHRILGPSIRDWHQHRVIPLKAKMMALAMMSFTLYWFSLGVTESWVVPALVSACIVPIAIFIATRPSRPSRPAQWVSNTS
jgi:uncharacterized membrane protein YbaN (DUF454 family)